MGRLILTTLVAIPDPDPKVNKAGAVTRVRVLTRAEAPRPTDREVRDALRRYRANLRARLCAPRARTFPEFKPGETTTESYVRRYMAYNALGNAWHLSVGENRGRPVYPAHWKLPAPWLSAEDDQVIHTTED